jgi:hypothetical protein
MRRSAFLLTWEIFGAVRAAKIAVLLFDQTRQVSETSNVLRGLSFKLLLSSSFARYFRVDDVEPIAWFKATRHEQQDAADVL